MTSDQREAARENAQRTYDRRRARKAADTLATIAPNRWDDETRRIIATLATISSPSRIDDALEAFDGQPADALIEIVGPMTLTDKGAAKLRRHPSHVELSDEYDPGPVPAEYDMPSPYEAPPSAWNSSKCVRGHQHATPDNAYACDMLPGASVHDNGDYRA